MVSKALCITDMAFEGQAIRLARNGELWFVLADVCQALELTNVTETARRLDDDEKGFSTIETLGGQQEVLIVSEPGLYKLIATSRKPVAVRFDRWVRHEVLPSIRKTGSYITPSQAPQMEAFSNFLDQKLEPIRTDIKEIKADLKVVVDNTNKGRKEPTVESLRIQHKVVRDHWFCLCPCEMRCGIRIADENGFIQGTWHYHHQYGAWNNSVEAGIPLAKECHQRIHNDNAARIRFDQIAFPEFQNALARMQPKQISMQLKLPDSKD